MKVNSYKNKNVFIAIRNSIKNTDDALDIIQKIFDNRNPELKDENDQCDDIVFIVNGVELDFNKFINNFAKQWNSLIEQRAIEIVEEKFDNLISAINDFSEDLEIQKEHFRKNYD